MPKDRALVALEQVALSDLGSRIRNRRRELGLTQQDLAGDDISAAYVSRIEAGQRRPEYAVALKLAHRLDTTVEYLATGLEPADRDEALLAIEYAELALRSGDADVAARDLLAMRERNEWQGDLALRATILLGLAYESLGQLDRAALLLEEALREADGVQALQVAQALCRCYREAGDLARSIQVGEEAQRRAEQNGLFGIDDEIRLTLTLVSAYYERGDVFYAAQLCQQVITRAEEQQSPSARAAAYWNASIIAVERGETRDALAMADRALALLSEGEDRRNLPRLRLQHAGVLLAQDDVAVDVAVQELLRAREELTTSDASAVDVAQCDVQLARALLLLGDRDEARMRASGAIERLRDGAPFVTAEAEVVLGRLAAAAGNLAQARDHYARGVASLTAAQADRAVAQLWYELGDLLEQAGDDVGARDAYRSASASLGLRLTAGSTVSTSR